MKRLTVVLIAGAGMLAIVGGCMLFSGPDAVIELSSAVGVVPLTITFSADASTCPGEVSTYRWTFGTNEEWYESNGTHTYTHAGRYTLTLTVRSADGKNSQSHGTMLSPGRTTSSGISTLA